MENLLVFDSTHQAIAIEALAKNLQLKARLIPIPESISAGCGLALKFLSDDLATVKTLADQEKMTDVTFYRVTVTNGKKTFSKIPLDQEEN